jgi:hypothetical protein
MTPGVVAESDLAGTLKSEYVFFDGERVARRDGATGADGIFYYFSDHLKTASVITDSMGVIKAESDVLAEVRALRMRVLEYGAGPLAGSGSRSDTAHNSSQG